MRQLPAGLRRVTPDVGWAGVLARFDAEVFGDEAWTPQAWVEGLRSAASFLAYVEASDESEEPGGSRGFAAPDGPGAPDKPWAPGGFAAPGESEAPASTILPVSPVAVGGIFVGPDADILTLGVAASRRGEHLGGMMLDDLLELARQGGSEYVFLEVRESNERARAMYESRGFVVVGRRKNYYRGEDGLTMRLRARE